MSSIKIFQLMHSALILTLLMLNAGPLGAADLNTTAGICSREVRGSGEGISSTIGKESTSGKRHYADTTAEAASGWVMRLRETRVVAERPMKEIGLQRTSFDSLDLKENISLSMADILTFNAPVFVKSYGRATLSTIAFRGTSASHTQVTWNDMKINNPMLGMTDFSTIPAYFIDDASLLHGTSSVNETGGGLGGAVKLSTRPLKGEGLGVQYIQGAGSFRTFDEFLRITWGKGGWQSSTRAVLSSSQNDYKYRNRDKKENIYDSNHNIIGQYYPLERNRSGSFRDLHILQELYCDKGRGNRFGLNIWYINSNRELPLLTTDYADETSFENRQREHTLRGIISWERYGCKSKIGAKAGYIYTWLAYDYKRDPGNGILSPMTRSRSKVNTLYSSLKGEFSPSGKWFFTGEISIHQHFVESADKNIILIEGGDAIVGYKKARMELSGSLSAKWRPAKWAGISLVLREELNGEEVAPVIPALFAEVILNQKWNMIAKASISKNYRYPTLNDMYFLPGGNPDLKCERGFTWDAGLSFDRSFGAGSAPAGSDSAGGTLFSLKGDINWFSSEIKDWIIWLPTTKGFFSPRNIKRVEAYGIESSLESTLLPGKWWKIALSGNFSWTPSINRGEPTSPADQSIGKQLPYIPEYSATANLRIGWRAWSLLYKWCHYSRRYTMSSNDVTLTGRLTPYYMSNLSIERVINLKSVGSKKMQLTLKGSINNLFNEEYLSVLSRPMPGINYEFFIGLSLF